MLGEFLINPFPSLSGVLRGGSDLDVDISIAPMQRPMQRRYSAGNLTMSQLAQPSAEFTLLVDSEGVLHWPLELHG